MNSRIIILPHSRIYNLNIKRRYQPASIDVIIARSPLGFDLTLKVKVIKSDALLLLLPVHSPLKLLWTNWIGSPVFKHERTIIYHVIVYIHESLTNMPKDRPAWRSCIVLFLANSRRIVNYPQ